MIANQLIQIRKFLEEESSQAIIIPSNDPHQSEYPPEHWKLREWASGFTGSAGLLVITLEDAGLWTDSRYFIQAEKELAGTGITLHKVYDRSAPGHLDWLQKSLHSGESILVLDALVSYRQYTSLTKYFKEYDIEVNPIEDPFSIIWTDRPALPTDKVFEHPEKYAGRSRVDKLELVRKAMVSKQADHVLLTALDEIAWTLNLRSTDVECNPVFIAYLLVSEKDAHLFINPEKIPADITASLVSDRIYIHSYEDIKSAMHALDDNDVVLLDKSQLNLALYNSVSKAECRHAESPVQRLKACKTQHELQMIDKCMIKDGVALAHAFYWLEKMLDENPVSEHAFAAKIAEFRSNQPDYFGESFHAIVGFAENGAIVHYRPRKSQDKMIHKKGILLVDCGGQYMDGTTDITRTCALGPVSNEEKTNYTLVLKGHIALASAVFPESTTGCQLDLLARQYLWQNGLNYNHGTGHGVGFFNNVHEGPQSISPSTRAKHPILEGMVSSNEPGYYKEGAYGIRIENLIACQKSSKEAFFEFKTVTLFPIDTRLIDTSLLDSRDIEWINSYHKNVLAKLGPHLDSELKAWLVDKCQDISV